MRLISKNENHEKRIHEIVEDCAACGYYYSNATSKGKYSGAMVGCQLSVENINGLYGYGSIKFHEYHTNCIEFGKVNSSYYVSEIFTDDENQLIFSQISCCFSDLCTREYMNMSFADSN
uniref:Uncharacterized protein n=1 Tax=Rhabditophanes sp. KR3021 TaxID=114890 RepID=A0AC35UH65_9BILA